MGDSVGVCLNTQRFSESTNVPVMDCKGKFMVRNTFGNGPELLCPVPTSTNVAFDEQPELRYVMINGEVLFALLFGKMEFNYVLLIFFCVFANYTYILSGLIS